MRPEVGISIAAILIAGIGLYLNILYRKKDFYNQILREQISAAYQIMETLIRLNNAYTEGYKKFVGASMAKYITTNNGQTPSGDLIKIWQTELHISLDAQYR